VESIFGDIVWWNGHYYLEQGQDKDFGEKNINIGIFHLVSF